MLFLSALTAVVALATTSAMAADATLEMGNMAFECARSAQFRFAGPMGARVDANVDNWLLRAPVANPGMIEMFRRRDRQPVPNLVPWAGEFVGKYLISAVQACRMSDDPRLKPFVADVLREFISTQAEDGYLGPFRKEERLLGHWDLWGHYHAMLALLMWYEDTGDESALQCAVRAADLACDTYLDGDRRVFDAGSHEMNMAIIHSLGRLYRTTGNERYLRMMRQIEKEWETPGAGDYFRTGLEGLDFFRTPKPRWESLHDLQGLVELFRITGDERYKRAFVQHWTSIRNYDRHPSGGFSTGEQAIGSPYSEGAIETCCTTAWMALTVDMLRLTGDPAAADELELSTWNSMLGSQHPSGRWWTYDTPLDGVRRASAHTIVFQARFGTPELNCCSVNAPRGLGMLSEWSVMLQPDGPVVNYYGPCEARLKLADGTAVTLRQETRYPAEGDVQITVGLEGDADTTVRLRIPLWSKQTAVKVNGAPVDGAQPGAYLPLKRRWKDGDVIELSLDMSPRHWTGELSKQGRAVVYRGPLLLAFDQKFNALDTDEIPTLNLAKLVAEPVERPCRFKPLVLLKLGSQDGQEMVLCDFATAGAHGTDYRAWLPAVNGAPAPFYLKRPRPDERIPVGPARFEWTGYRASAAAGRTFTLEIARDAAFEEVVARQEGIKRARAVVRDGLAANETYLWRVTAINANGATQNCLGPRRFTVDPELPTISVEDEAAELGEGEVMVASPLDGSPKPSFGALEEAVDVARAAGRFGNDGSAVAFNGTTSKITYQIPFFPEDDYTAYAWVCPEGLPTDRLHQVFSAWATGMDDPLRIVIQGDEVFARIEAGGAFGTAGVRLQNGVWTHVAAVKQADRLFLYVNGELKHTCTAPPIIYSAARNIAIGANPNFTGNERLLGKLDGFAFYARALTAEEIANVYRGAKP